jgi:hemerythrin-like domain-containing protein
MALPIIHMLKHEHRTIERVLRAMEGLSFRLACKERVPAEALSEVVDFIGHFIDGYHHPKEETHLFPLLQKQGIVREGGPLGVIEHEHRIERHFIDQLQAAVQGLQADNEPCRQRFIEAARKYIAHLTTHMQQEEAILFRLAEELVDASDSQAAVSGFRQAEKEFGESAVQHYENLAAGLEEKWAL